MGCGRAGGRRMDRCALRRAPRLRGVGPRSPALRTAIESGNVIGGCMVAGRTARHSRAASSRNSPRPPSGRSCLCQVGTLRDVRAPFAEARQKRADLGRREGTGDEVPLDLLAAGRCAGSRVGLRSRRLRRRRQSPSPCAIAIWVATSVGSPVSRSLTKLRSIFSSSNS